MNKTPTRPTFDRYPQWCTKHLDIGDIEIVRRYYETLTLSIHKQVLASDQWSSVSSYIPTLDDKYLSDTTYDLVIHRTPPELLIKPFDSLLEKTFRINIVENANYPNAPIEGWVSPVKPFGRVRDIIRARLIVKYVDGVTFAASELEKMCQSVGCDPLLQMEAKPEGYYAAHLYWRTPVELYDMDYSPYQADIHTELEITTQIQEVVQRLLHRFYERRRSKPVSTDQWAWTDLGTHEFTASYMGHILHYVDATIVDVRSRTNEHND